MQIGTVYFGEWQVFLEEAPLTTGKDIGLTTSPRVVSPQVTSGSSQINEESDEIGIYFFFLFIVCSQKLWNCTEIFNSMFVCSYVLFYLTINTCLIVYSVLCKIQHLHGFLFICS